MQTITTVTMAASTRWGSQLNTAPGERTLEQPMLPVLLAVGAGTAFATATLFGLALALVGLFDPLVVAAASVVVGSLVVERLHRSAIRWLDAPALVLLAVAGASVLANGAYASEHTVTDRDPGVYLNVAVSLAREGSLVVNPAVDRFGDANVQFSTAGNIYDEDDDVVRPQFFHGFAVAVATVDGVLGHRIALRVPAMLGGLGLLTIGVFMRRLVRPWYATLATSALALCLVQVWISRDAYSEVLAQPLLWLSLVLVATLADALRDPPRGNIVGVLALAAGLAMAALSVTRVEAPLLLPLLVLVGYQLRRHRTSRNVAVAVFAPPVVGLFLWLLDFVVVAEPYWYLTPRLVRLAAASVVLGIVVALTYTPRVRRSIGTVVAGNGRQLALGSAGVVVAIFALGLLRARFLIEKRSVSDAGMRMIEAGNGLAPEGLRTYAEQSVEWLTWYLGWPAFVLGVLGLAALTRSAIASDGPRIEHGLLLTAVVPLTLLYLWKPSIYPDQLWAMRRYVVSTFPLLALGIAAGVDAVVRSVARAGRRRLVASGLWLGAFAGVAATTIPVRDINPYDMYLGQIEEVCGSMPTGAVVLVDPTDELDVTYIAPVRAFCGVPTAGLLESSLDTVHHAAGEIRALGGEPVLLSSRPQAFEPLLPVATFTVVNPRHQGFDLSKPNTLTTSTSSVSVFHL